MGKKGPYTVLDRKEVYKNPWIAVHEEQVIHPDGKKGFFGLVDYQPGTSIVALNKDRNVYLIKKYFYILETYGYELPTGGIDANEQPLDAAKRELREETGLQSDEWSSLGFVNPFTMIIKSKAHLFLAKNAVKVEERSDTSEIVEVVAVPFEEAYQMVMDNKIYHGQSCVALLKVKTLMDSKKL